MPPVCRRVATRLVVLALPALTLRKEKLTETVSLGSMALLAGAQFSAARDGGDPWAMVARKSSLRIVPVAWLRVKLALTWPLRLTKKVSLDSLRVSAITGTKIV